MKMHRVFVLIFIEFTYILLSPILINNILYIIVIDKIMDNKHSGLSSYRIFTGHTPPYALQIHIRESILYMALFFSMLYRLDCRIFKKYRRKSYQIFFYPF